jgi:FkbM family methyltransferase
VPCFFIGTLLDEPIRTGKVYEPNFYPNTNGLIPYFEKYFGPDSAERKQHVCTLAFEPIPRHNERLNALQRSYQALGWPLVIFTQTAVGNEKGSAIFFVDMRQEGESSRVVAEHEKDSTRIRDKEDIDYVMVVDLNHLLNNVFRLWKVSPGYNATESKVFAKMDIEGAEYSVLPHMIFGDSLCHIDGIAVEYHGFQGSCFPRQPRDIDETSFGIKWLSHLKCKTVFEDVDDESYRRDGCPLPTNPYNASIPCVPLKE